jgi:hypothetical protein
MFFARTTLVIKAAPVSPLRVLQLGGAEQFGQDVCDSPK